MPRPSRNDTHLHSFTLHKPQSEIIENVQDQKKSAWVRSAISHYRKWLDTDYRQIKLGEFVGPIVTKNINLEFEELEEDKHEWVKKAIELNQRLKKMEEELQDLKSKKWWQFWK
jgi:hypothetical protein